VLLEVVEMSDSFKSILPNEFNVVVSPPVANYHKDFGFICLAALRYCFGRMTYAPELVVAFVKEYWEFLHVEDQKRILKEVKEFLDDPYLSKGMDCDKVTWTQFFHWMSTRVQ
jgi:alpha-glucuronidase